MVKKALSLVFESKSAVPYWMTSQARFDWSEAPSSQRQFENPLLEYDDFDKNLFLKEIDLILLASFILN